LKGCHPSSTFRRTRPVICHATLIPLAGLGAPWIVWGTREARVQMSGKHREPPRMRAPLGRWRMAGSTQIDRTPGEGAMKPRVLVVEDNPLNLELMVALLEHEGCELLA
jgi:hypothetical protein